MSDSPVAVSAGPVATFTESVWVWRRWFIFTALLLSFVCIAGAIVFRVDWRVTMWLCIVVITISVLYIVAPTAEQLLSGLTKLAALRIPGVSLVQTSTASSGAASATATSSAGTATPPSTDDERG